MTGRRGLAVCLATVLALALMVPVVLAAEETVKDSFSQPIYTGGTGWLASSNWTEVNDGGSASSGSVQAVTGGDCYETSCLRFGSIVSLAVGIQRSANFDDADSVRLSFRYKKSGLGTLEVRAGPTAGSWSTVQTMSNASSYNTMTLDISDAAGPTTTIMFWSTVGLLSSAYVDNVSITANYPPTSSTTTTSTTIASTTTTSEPLITVPTVTIPPLLTTTTSTTITVPPLLTTTTTASSSTTTTIGGSGTSTTTSTTTPPGTGGGGSDSPPGGGSGDGDQATFNPPLTGEDLEFAAESNIVVNLVGEGDFGGFEPGIGINPMTDLWVNLNTTVEAISTEILSALALGAMIAFFGVRRVTDDEAVAQT